MEATADETSDDDGAKERQKKEARGDQKTEREQKKTVKDIARPLHSQAAV